MPVSWLTNQNGPERVVAIPMTPQDYDRVTVTAVADVNFSDQLPVGANSRAAQKVVFYLHWLTVTQTNFPAAFAGVVGDVRIQFLNNAAAVVFGPVIVKEFSAASGNAIGSHQPYIWTPAAPLKVTYSNAGLATAVNAQLIAHVVAIAGAPSFFVEICTSLDPWNTGPVGSFGGQDSVAQGANNPNQF